MEQNKKNLLAWEVYFGPRGGEPGIVWIERIQQMAKAILKEKGHVE